MSIRAFLKNLYASGGYISQADWEDIVNSDFNLDDDTITPDMIQSAPSDMGAANITVDLSNSNGSYVTNLITDGSVTATSFETAGVTDGLSIADNTILAEGTSTDIDITLTPKGSGSVVMSNVLNLKGDGLELPHTVNKAASANVRNTHPGTEQSTLDEYTKVKTITFNNGLLGEQRFLFDIGNDDNATTVYGRIYKNGAALGTEQTTTNGGSSITVLEAVPTDAGSGYLVADVLSINEGIGGTASVATTTVGALDTLDATPTNGGLGYLPTDVLTLTEGTGGTATVATIDVTGGIETITIDTAGTGYTEGTVSLTVTGGNSDGVLSCTADAGGTIVSIDNITTIGTGYSVAGPLATTGGGNNDCTVSITEINGAIVTIDTAPTSVGSGYTTGTGKETTGGTGTGATLSITAVDGVIGGVTGVTLLTGGVDYTTGVGKATTSDNGTGCTVEITTVSSYVTKSEDIEEDWNPGDTCELYIKSDGSANATVKNFKVAYDDAPTVTVSSTNS